MGKKKCKRRTQDGEVQAAKEGRRREGKREKKSGQTQKIKKKNDLIVVERDVGADCGPDERQMGSGSSNRKKNPKNKRNTETKAVFLFFFGVRTFWRPEIKAENSKSGRRAPSASDIPREKKIEN